MILYEFIDLRWSCGLVLPETVKLRHAGMLWDDDENKHHWIEREKPTGFTMVLP